MIKKLIFLFSFLFPICLYAQDAFSDCDKVFKTVQHLPSLIISNEAYEDTLSTVLQLKKYRFKDDVVALRFVITDKSKIDELVPGFSSDRNDKILREAVQSLAALWKPAVQNGYEVCFYVQLTLKFTDKKIDIEISQQ